MLRADYSRNPRAFYGADTQKHELFCKLTGRPPCRRKETELACSYGMDDSRDSDFNYLCLSGVILELGCGDKMPCQFEEFQRFFIMFSAAQLCPILASFHRAQNSYSLFQLKSLVNWILLFFRQGITAVISL